MIKSCVVCGKEFNALGSANCCGAECIGIRNCARAAGYNRKWAEAHPERVGKWNAEHPERRLAAKRKWAAEHPDSVREQRRKWKVTHRKTIAKQGQRYGAAHAEEIRERQRRYHAAHPENHRRSMLKYRSTERGKAVAVAIRHNRRVRLSDIPMTADTVLELRTEYGGLCPYCNQPIAKGHIDHIVPVCKGGTNERENLVWACAKCNAQKNNKSLLEFLLYRMSEVSQW